MFRGFFSRENVQSFMLAVAWLWLILCVLQAIEVRQVLPAGTWFIGGLLVFCLLYLLVYACEDLGRLADNSRPQPHPASEQPPTE